MSHEDAVSRAFPVTAEEVAKANGYLTDEDINAATPVLAPSPFVRDLEHLINRHSVENESDTPDFILAQYLRGCLDVWDHTIRERDRWYGFKPWPDRDCELPGPKEETHG
jgi:hypothetical protein